MEKTNYFEFYGQPASLEIDEALLKKKFYQLSRSFHPDFHTLASEKEQDLMLDQASLNNAAYKTLSNFDSRLKHLLQLYGILEEEGENKVPQDFLMDMMELNEDLMELEMEPSKAAKEQILEKISQVEQTTQDLIESVRKKNFVSEFDEDDWSTLRDFYLKSRYLQRLRSGADNLVQS